MDNSIQLLARKNIRALQPYASARSEFKGSARVFLDANENPFDTGLNRYPDPLQWELKEKIAEIKQVPASRIFLGNGSDEAIDLLFRIFCEPGEDHVITLPPTYGMYRVSADIADVEVREVPLSRELQPDVTRIMMNVDPHSKLLFICSPNNPTGNCMDRELVLKLLDTFPGIIVIDEAYIDFAEGPSYTTLLDDYPNLVIMQTFSKAWGMAGIRLGMAFASEEIIALFNKVKPPYNVNQLTQKTALEQLQRLPEMQERVRVLLDERQRLQRALERLDYVQYIYPTEANFILVRVNDAAALYQYLVEREIIVRDRSRVIRCAGSLRISVGRPDENVELLQALQEFAQTVSTSDSSPS